MSSAPAQPLRERLLRSLGERSEPLRVSIEEARRAGVATYLVGGPVRDLLLDLPIGDLDVLLPGALEQVAVAIARRLGGRAVLRPRFLTATVIAGELRIDLSQARRERYVRPGALPQVKPSTLEDDFRRRDFSLNTMALPLDAHAGAALLDPCGGRADLERGRVRVLHPGSFRDDPTRMLRAARYCARLGFRLSPETGQLLREAIAADALQTISHDRVRHEIEKLLDESDAARGAAATQRLGLFAAISPGWRLTASVQHALRRLTGSRRGAPWPEATSADLQRACGMRLLFCGLPARARARGIAALGLRGRRAEAVESDLRELPRLQRALARGPSAGKLDALLASADEPLLLLLYCATHPPAPRLVKRYASTLRHQASPLDGHAVRALGLEGPAIGQLVRAARQRALDGRPVEEPWLRSWLARRRAMR